MIPNTPTYIASGRKELIILILFYWLSIITILILLIVSFKADKPQLVIIILYLLLLRTYAPLLDIEERRYSYSYNKLIRMLFFILIQ
jgi:hypothetical protein